MAQLMHCDVNFYFDGIKKYKRDGIYLFMQMVFNRDKSIGERHYCIHFFFNNKM